MSTFPSRLHVSGGRLLDADGLDVGTLKGFCAHVGARGTAFVWPQADYDAMAAAGARIVRHIIHWDALEPEPGSIDPTLLATVDTANARAQAAGLYVLLDCPHLNVGRAPAWAQTEPNEWLDYVTHGENITKTMASRYADDPAVIGMNANEPPAAHLGELMDGYDVIVPCYRELAPDWPLWLQGCRFGGGTPYPSGAGQIQLDPARYAALDTNSRGCVIEYHDYFVNDNGDRTTYPNGYLPNGVPAKVNQVGRAGWRYTGGYAYPDTDQARAGFARHVAPWAKFAATGSFVLAIAEFGLDNTLPGEAAFGADKASCYDAIGAQVQMWWNYDRADVSRNKFSARPGGVWRAAVTQWLPVSG